jgi:hypothetical protein
MQQERDLHHRIPEKDFTLVLALELLMQGQLVTELEKQRLLT